MRNLLSRIKRKLVRLGLIKPATNQTTIKLTGNSKVVFNPDHLNINYFSGWVVRQNADKSDPRTVNIKVFRGDNLVGDAAATLPRVDISSAGKGPLNCGYQCRLYWRHFEEGINKCRVLADDEHVADIMLYVSVKDLLVGQADELAVLLAK